MKIQWKGASEMGHAISDAMKNGNSEIAEAVRKSTAKLQQREMQEVPVDTGFLKRSITMDISDNGLTGTVEPTANYAAYVEYGTRYAHAQPYIRPSYEKTAKEFESEMKRLNFWK